MKAKQIPLKTFRKEQMQIVKEFGITLTDEQIQHFYSLPTEISIENYKLALLGIGGTSASSGSKNSMKYISH